MVWQLPRQQSDKPDGQTDEWTQGTNEEIKVSELEKGGRSRFHCGNGSAYKNNLASNKIGKIASNWIRKMRAVALLSIGRRGMLWYGMVPADLLKHLLRELWEVGGGGRGGQLPAKHPQWAENIKRVFYLYFFRLCNPFTHLRSLNKYCESAVRGEGRGRGEHCE